MKKTILLITIAAVLAAVLPAAAAAAPAQTIRVLSYPLTVVDAKTGTITVTWDDNAGGPAPDATLIYGTSSMSYPLTITVGSIGNTSFNPASKGMTGGVYYFRLSNNAAVPDCWSNEYRFFIGKAGGMNVSDIKFSPNPFSGDLPIPGLPGQKGLKITYLPDSDKSTAVKISIKAYTMDGKLIRAIASGEMKTAGAAAVTVWDGKTDMGYFAKNGRYIIQLEAEDSTGKKQYLNTVVMVK